MQISNEYDQRVAMAAQAAGSSNVNGNVIDMKDAGSSIAYLLQLGTITSGAVTGAKIQEGELADGSDMTDVEDAVISIPDTASGKCFCLEQSRVTKRYSRLVVTRATQNAVIAGAQCLIGDGRHKPTTAHSSYGGGVQVAS